MHHYRCSLNWQKFDSRLLTQSLLSLCRTRVIPIVTCRLKRVITNKDIESLSQDKHKTSFKNIMADPVNRKMAKERRVLVIENGAEVVEVEEAF